MLSWGNKGELDLFSSNRRPRLGKLIRVLHLTREMPQVVEQMPAEGTPEEKRTPEAVAKDLGRAAMTPEDLARDLIIHDIYGRKLGL